MRRKVFKIGTVLLACVCLVSILSFPVSAESESYEALPITVTKVWTNHVDNNTYTRYDTNYYSIGIPYDAGKNQFASLWTVNNTDTKNYYNYKFKFYFNGIEPTDFTLTFNGVTYEVLKKVVDSYETYYYVDIHDIRLTSANSRLDVNFSWTSGTKANIFFQAFYQYSDLNPIIDNQNENTDKIMQNQNDNTDKVLNDWDGGKNVDDGTADNFKNAEDAALSGKTDEEIHEEINNAIDFDINIFDSNKIGKMHNLFDNVLSSCGSSYQALFMLCLTLGLAAFLIGRRYG